MKKVLTIQDISCIGKCSLTVALPILSVLGNETAIIPTAVLSTHTAFKDFTFKDLSDEILKIIEHWTKENFVFSSIYTGYLGSIRQIKIIESILEKLKFDYFIVDPVMADNGKFYKGFNAIYANSMMDLCLKADVIIPNVTEAHFLLKKTYTEYYDVNYIKEMLLEFKGMGIKNPIITGVKVNDKLGVVAYIGKTNQFFEYYKDHVEKSIHGTGDIFASVFTGLYSNGISIETSLKIAVDFVYECILNSQNSDIWYGSEFEKTLPYLIKQVNSIKKL